MSSYFIPPVNNNVSNNKRGHSQFTTHSTSFPPPSSGGGYAQPPPSMNRGGFIPPPVGAMHASGQTVLQCSRCREMLPPGLDLATHLLGCGAAELFTKAFTPFDYPARPKHTGASPNFQSPPPNYDGRSGFHR